MSDLQSIVHDGDFDAFAFGARPGSGHVDIFANFGRNACLVWLTRILQIPLIGEKRVAAVRRVGSATTTASSQPCAQKDKTDQMLTHSLTLARFLLKKSVGGHTTNR
jgi:hypothetical protein